MLNEFTNNLSLSASSLFYPAEILREVIG